MVVRLADLAQLLVRLDPRRPLAIESINVSLEGLVCHLLQPCLIGLPQKVIEEGALVLSNVEVSEAVVNIPLSLLKDGTRDSRDLQTRGGSEPCE